MTVNIRKRLTILFAFLCVCGLPSCSADIVLTQGGKSAYTIVAGPGSGEREAAGILQSYIQRISGVKLPVVGDGGPVGRHEIVIGNNRHAASLGFKATGTGNFKISTKGNHIVFTANGSDNYVYAAYTFVEKYLGARKYSGADEAVVQKRDEIRIPTISDAETTPVAYRELFYNVAYHKEYRDWHKLDFFDVPKTEIRPGKWGLWGHAFFQLIPPAKYFKQHPEFFSLRNNKRIPDGQLCLSNKQMVQTAIVNMRAMVAANPKAAYWSVSAADNDLYCECSQCKALDDREGTPGASVLNFANTIAAQFPTKTIVMLAYHYTSTPPKTMMPRQNVMIEFSTINAYRNKPIATGDENRLVLSDFMVWRKKTSNIMIWDYVTNMNHFLSPFPDFGVMQKNIQFFVSQGVKGFFMQGNNHKVTEFAELKAYLLAKLMWNPNASTQDIIKDFTNGYYGAAGPFVKQYIDEMTAALNSSGQRLGLGDAPAAHINGYLSPAMQAKYNNLITQAEKAAANSPVYRERVSLLRLNLDYVSLEQKRQTNASASRALGKTAKAVNSGNEQLEKFVRDCKAAAVTRLDDGGTTIEQYAEKYLRGE